MAEVWLGGTWRRSVCRLVQIRGEGSKVRGGRAQGRRLSWGLVNVFMAEDGIKPLMEKGNSDDILRKKKKAISTNLGNR